MNVLLRHLPFLLFIVLTAGWFIPAYNATLTAMHDHSQHMEYVWLIPLLSLFLLWTRKKEILRCATAPEPQPLLALPLFLLASFALFLGFRGGQDRFLQIAAILLLVAIPLACYGKKMFKTIWFPILLLAFILPIGFLDNFTVPLRRASVSVTTFILNGLGIFVKQMGTAIISTGTQNFQLDVADPCSGIRSIVALFVGTAAYGAVMLKRTRNRWILFAMSIPIAFFGNVLRLLLTAFTCHLVSQHAGLLLHDHALFIVAPIYTLLIFFLTDWLKRFETKTAATPQAEETSPTPRRTPLFKILLLLVFAIGLHLLCRFAQHTPPLTYEDDTFIQKTFAVFPNAVIHYPWFCQNRACLYSFDVTDFETIPEKCPQCEGEVRRVSKAELDILPADTQSRKVTYTFASGETYTVALVISGKNRMSIHRPELCLPSQGYVLSERQIIRINENLPMATFSLHRRGSSSTSGFAYVFFNSKTATVSNLERVLGDCWERSLHNRILRWGMLTVTSPQHNFQTPEGEAALKRFMEQFYPTLFVDHAH